MPAIKRDTNERIFSGTIRLRRKSTSQSHRASIYYQDLTTPDDVPLSTAIAQAKQDAARVAKFGAAAFEVSEEEGLQAVDESMPKRRCLIPATGYYEWQARDGNKQPFHIHLPRQHPFLMAGIWDYRSGDESQPTVAILTTKAPMDQEAIHDRMPVIIPNELIYSWFEQPDNRLLMPLSSGVFLADRISTRVNIARNEEPGVLEQQGSLHK